MTLLGILSAGLEAAEKGTRAVGNAADDFRFQLTGERKERPDFLSQAGINPALVAVYDEFFRENRGRIQTVIDSATGPGKQP